MSYPRGASWRDYPVTLTYPNGRTYPATVRAISHRDADYRAAKRWPLGGPIRFAIGDPDDQIQVAGKISTFPGPPARSYDGQLSILPMPQNLRDLP